MWFAVVAAAAVPEASAAPDLAAGKALAVSCQACHAAVNPNSDTPHLAGQRERYLGKALAAFKAGARKHDLMSAIAHQLSDDEIQDLSAFWASQPAGSDAAEPPEVAPIRQSQMTFPRDFPRGFTLYSTTSKDEDRTVARAFINATGLAAARAGKALPDGTIILVVSYAARLDAGKKPIADKDGSWVVDKITGYAGMEARAGWGKDIPALLRNGTWNYGIFGPDKAPRSAVSQATCLACHKPLAATGYVFQLKDIQAKAGR
ncbi:MAG TPA: cytochrome P460 family protein [Kofleriaceae bacterium]